jgi:hypothetical protein
MDATNNIIYNFCIFLHRNKTTRGFWGLTKGGGWALLKGKERLGEGADDQTHLHSCPQNRKKNTPLIGSGTTCIRGMKLLLSKYMIGKYSICFHSETFQ